MNVFMVIGSILLFLVGVFSLVFAKSDIQIILAVLCFGFGLLAFGLSGIMSRLDCAADERRRSIGLPSRPL
jgi:multisubunit Na+/H+ antiporter MnhC subunit